MTSDIVLIGPIGAGKSTLGELLAARLKLPQCSMDDRRWAYYKEIGYDEAVAQQKRAAGGWSLHYYWKPFEAYAVGRLLAECRNCVIDFGAGHSVYENARLFQSVKQALVHYSNVVLLLPSPNVDESIRILNERNSDLPDNTRDIYELFVRHPSNRALAKRTIHTEGKAPAESCDEILEQIKAHSY